MSRYDPNIQRPQYPKDSATTLRPVPMVLVPVAIYVLDALPLSILKEIAEMLATSSGAILRRAVN